MNLLQQILFHKRQVVDAMATWASVRGMREINRHCYGLVEAIDDEIERLDEAASKTEEE